MDEESKPGATSIRFWRPVDWIEQLRVPKWTGFAAPVGDDLHFKVVEAADALFDEHAFVLELAECVVADTPVHGAELIDVVHFLNAHAAAARGSLTRTSGRVMPCWSWKS